MRAFRIVLGTVAVGLAGVAVQALRPRPLDVEVARVQRGPLEQDVVDQGRARVRERYTVSAPVAGTLARIEVHEGDAVEPGTVLARLLPLASPLLDPESRRAAEQRLGAALDGSEQAKATALRAQLASESAESELVRATALAKRGAVVAADLDRATSAAKMQEAELASARFAAKVAAHEIDVARLALARFTPGASRSEELVVTSPVHGQVLHVLHRSEGVVSPGEPLLEVGDPAAIELVADVLSADAAAIEPGMTARVDHWGGPHSLVAKVRRVEPAAFTKISALGVDEQRVNVLLDLQGPPAEWRGLGDGFSAEIAIAVWSKPDAIQAPTSTLFRRNDAWSVFVVEDGRARERAVSPTHRGPLQTEVERGLAPDDVVILHPGGAVRDGSRVAFR